MAELSEPCRQRVEGEFGLGVRVRGLSVEGATV